MAAAPKLCLARTERELEGLDLCPYYCTREPHDPDEDHEAVAADGPFTWWDPTEGEPEDA